MKTIKQVADEIGVSKQAVYKRLKGKLASVCAPYVHTEHSKTFLSDEGVSIVKSDFEQNPCLTAPHTECSKPHTECSKPHTECSEPHTECSKPHTECSKPHTECSEPHTECSKPHTERSKPHTERSKPHTERSKAIQENSSLKEENEQLKIEVSELNEQLSKIQHQFDLKEQEVVHLNSDIEKLNHIIEDLRIDKADLQQHRDNLTNALTMSKSDLARLENIVTKMAALPLATRIFKWTDTVAYLTEYESPKLDIVDVDIDE